MIKSRFIPGTHKVSELIDLKIIDIGDGYRAKNSEMSAEGMPFARAGNINDGFHFESADKLGDEGVAKAAEKISMPGDVLFTSKGTVGRFALVKEDTPQFVYSPQLCYWRSKEHSIIYPKFLYYWMSGPGFISQINSVKGQTDMADYVNLRDQRMMHIQVPPLPVQHQIAAILSAFDEKIELNRQMNRTLEQMARALFKSWFIDFDPVHAKQRGEQPAGMDAETAALFPDRFVEIDGKEIPEGWEWGNVHKNFQLTMGQSPPGDTYNESGEGLPFYQGKTDFGFRFPKKRIYCSTPARLARRGSTLVSVRAPVGSANIAIEECAIGRGVASILHSSNSKSFTYYSVLSSRQYLEQFNGEGTVFGSINKAAFEAMETIEPEAKVIERFEELVGTLDNAIEMNERSASLLISLRDSLLPRLLSGQLDVGDWEKVNLTDDGSLA